SETFRIREIRVEGDNPEAFRVIDLSGDSLAGRDLTAGASETVDVEFLPPHVGEFNATLVLFLDDDPQPQTPVPIRGRALWVDARGSGGFGCSTGGSPRASAVLVLALLFGARRRRR